MHKLNVMRITPDILAAKWKVRLPLPWCREAFLYIRCNAKGQIKWDSAPVYFLYELQRRGNFQIHIYSI